MPIAHILFSASQNEDKPNRSRPSRSSRAKPRGEPDRIARGASSTLLDTIGQERR